MTEPKKFEVGATQEAKAKEVIEQTEVVVVIRTSETFVKEAITRMMAQTKAIITIVVEAVKSGSLSIGDSR